LKVIILKTGALGDVLRTSYFTKYLRLSNKCSQIDWYTDESALPLIKSNPYINKIFTRNEFAASDYDRVYSLDDEEQIIQLTNGVPLEKITGAHLYKDRLDYTHDSAYWFDMGLISKLGKKTADKIKKQNQKSHIEIFEKIFQVNNVTPNSYLNCQKNLTLYRQICITPAAGKRWPSKSLRAEELLKLVRQVTRQGQSFKIVGTTADLQQYRGALDKFEKCLVVVNSIEELSNEIFNSDIQITADTLALHIGQSLGKKMISFFSATSATEIPSMQNLKICSTAGDYCSYNPNANNQTITADRIYDALINYL
jgi:heptosyltransferase II